MARGSGAGGPGRWAGPRDSRRLSPAGRFFYQRLVEFMARYLLRLRAGSAGRQEGACVA